MHHRHACFLIHHNKLFCSSILCVILGQALDKKGEGKRGEIFSYAEAKTCPVYNARLCPDILSFQFILLLLLGVFTSTLFVEHRIEI
jgi:hypothetical protein